MERPFVFSARRHRCYPGSLTFFNCLDKIVPRLDLGRVNTGFLQILVVPEDHRSNIVRQSIGFTVRGEILNTGRVKRIFEPAFCDRLGNILANA